MGARGMGTETLPNLSLATCGAAREVKTWPRQQPKSESLLDGGLQLRAKPSGSSLAKGQNLPIVSELRQLTQQLQPPRALLLHRLEACASGISSSCNRPRIVAFLR